jgi:general secretion pathway protein G
MVKARAQKRPQGFTLIELMVVMTIMSILVGIALPQFRASIVQAREAVLKEDLFRMREAIDQYYADKGRYPASLAALVEDGYLRQIQADPITRAADWVEVPAEAEGGGTSSEQPGVYDVRSASSGVSMNGTPYSEW